MLEQELNPAASKFISSLVKSLQILCNGQVDFNESIELIGHINVRVDRVHKYDYIVDEHVSKEGSDSSTTFLSNSYHSFPPSKSLQPLALSQAEQQTNPKQNVGQDIPPSRNTHTVKVSHKVPTGSRKQDNIMVKMEGSDNDCMVLPASPEDYEPVDDVGSQDGGPLPGTSSTQSESFDMDYDAHHSRHSNQTGKKRKMEDHNPEEGGTETKVFSRNYYNEQYSSAHYSSNSVCNQCGQWFYDMNELQFHRSNCPAAHSSYYQEVPPDYSEESEFDTCSCTICGCIVRNNRERLQHMNTEHNITIYHCPSCSEIFGSSRLLHQHKKMKHGGSQAIQLKCTMCEKSFTTPLNLKGHMNMHLGLKPYVCNICGEAFAYNQSKHRHQKCCGKNSRLPTSEIF